MLVKDEMTPNPLTVTPDTAITEAQEIMQSHNIRHLPVVDENLHIVGLLNRETMLQAMPWSATHLSAFETQYILSKVKASNVMLREVITVTEDEAVEEAARIMVDRKVNCLLVVRDEVLVGVITDIDLLSITMEMLGARRPGLRLSVMIPHRAGQIARLTAAIASISGNLTAFGTWEGEVDSTAGIPEKLGIVLRVEGVSKENLLAVVQKIEEFEVLEVREM
jgi:acetoin utilization protein AcuB